VLSTARRFHERGGSDGGVRGGILAGVVPGTSGGRGARPGRYCKHVHLKTW